MENVHVVSNPFVADALTHLRDKTTATQEFRHFSDIICQILIAESLKDVSMLPVTIETPLTTIKGQKLAENVIVIPILRAGVAMLPSALTVFPKAKVGFIGLQRDEQTAIAKEYYWKMPHITAEDIVLITDPMLATGGSTVHLLHKIAKKQTKIVRVVCVIAAPEGIHAIQKAFPNVHIITAAVDDHLNDKKFIVPGLGDYGDRYFGTTEQ
ncbi:MAG: uracil phosphoribosyltransferase [Candidatus Levybacteria bacterium]|nr:uracil phosphoribosyltransferase [Candidatus Levybacteria bacterium]